MLKNWTTTFKSIKTAKGGFMNYVGYLENDKHRNHKDENHRIVNFDIDKRKIYVNNKRILDSFNYEKILKNKGGRPSKSLGVSVVVSFPFKVENDEKLNEYKDKLIQQYYIDLCKINKINYNKESYLKYKSLVYVNCHLKDQGSQTQFNLTLPHYLPFKSVVESKNDGLMGIGAKDEKYKIGYRKIDMSQKKYSYLMKQLNNKLCLNIFNIDNNNYKVKNPKNHKKKEKIGTYKVNKKIEELKNSIYNLSIQKEKIESFGIEFKTKLTKFEENVKVLEENKIDNQTIKTYQNRLEESINKNDVVAASEQLEKIEKYSKKVYKYNNIEM